MADNSAEIVLLISQHLHQGGIIRGVSEAALADIVKKIPEALYRGMAGDDTHRMVDLFMAQLARRGIDPSDPRIRDTVHGAVKSVLKEIGGSTALPIGAAEPATVPISRESATRLKAIMAPREPRPADPAPAPAPAAPSIEPPAAPAVASPSDPFIPAPVQPEAATDPMRSSSSGMLPIIRKESSVEAAFNGAVQMVLDRLPPGTYESRADFIADAYNDTNPDPKLNRKEKLRRLTARCWVGADIREFEHAFEQCFINGFAKTHMIQKSQRGAVAVRRT